MRCLTRWRPASLPPYLPVATHSLRTIPWRPASHPRRCGLRCSRRASRRVRSRRQSQHVRSRRASRHVRSIRASKRVRSRRASRRVRSIRASKRVRSIRPTQRVRNRRPSQRVRIRRPSQRVRHCHLLGASRPAACSQPTVLRVRDCPSQLLRRTPHPHKPSSPAPRVLAATAHTHAATSTRG
jgi:hypothetical protein